jgi:hypothetical protein
MCEKIDQYHLQIYFVTHKSDTFRLFCARLLISLPFLWLIKTSYCIFLSVRLQSTSPHQLVSSPTDSAAATLHFQFISFQLQEFQEIKDATRRATVNGAVFYRITARGHKIASFRSKSFSIQKLV